MGLTVVYLGNSRSVFSNRHFLALIGSACRIAGVVDAATAKQASTNPESSTVPTFTEVAKRRDIPVFAPASPNDSDFVRVMNDLSPDLLLAVGYPKLLGSQLLAVPRIAPVNFHASLLPAYRGRHPVFWALRNGERQTGLTVHLMDATLDTGEILYQVRVRTRRCDSVATLYDRIMDRSVGLVPRLVDDAANRRLRPRPQGKCGASYYSSVSEEDFRLDWTVDAERLRRWICATPGRCFCYIARQQVFCLDAALERYAGTEAPGTVIRIGRTNCVVAAGRNALSLRRVQLPSADAKPAAHLCRERGIRKGYRLG